VSTLRVVCPINQRHLPDFKWVKTVLGSLKTTMAGAFKALKFRKYAKICLAAFDYRSNQRFDLRNLFATIIVDMARSRPIKRKVITCSHAETRF
jgi:hypothetical protein